MASAEISFNHEKFRLRKTNGPAMSKSLVKKIDVFLTVDLQTMSSYFNPHDPAPLYKRQINYKLEEYIMASVATAKRYSNIYYKLKCSNDVDRQYAEPLMYAIKRHFNNRKLLREDEFKKFKKRNYIVLAATVAIVIALQGLVSMLLSDELRMHTGLENCVDVFSWVLLWKPINELVYYWNPHLKEILLLNKLSTAEVIIIVSENSNENKLQKKNTITEKSDPVMVNSLKSAMSI